MKAATKTTTKTAKNNKQQAKVGTAKQSTEQGLRDLFENELQDIYWAEMALTKAIPKMISNATSDELIESLTDHLAATHTHVKRLEEVFESIGAKAQGRKCEAMAGLIKEAEHIMADNEKGDVRDAGIILATQKIEHYEIATYGTLRAFANTLEEHKAESLLEDTLDEEKEVDERLSEIAESHVNMEAAGVD